MKISDFFKNEMSDYSCYSTYRMIASAVDGLKNAQRKSVYVAISDLKNSVKVSQFAGNVALKTEYLHGDVSLQGVIQGLASDYCGSNNLPIFEGEGNFGTRFMPTPSAPRYTYINRPKYFDDIFDVRDVFEKQYFEGEEIEPKFLLPAIPLLVVNGSLAAIGSGFRQDILPRSIPDILKYYKGEKTNLVPHFKGFKGDIIETELGKFLVKGKYERVKKDIVIYEIPVGYSYRQYLDVLDNSGFKYEDFSDAEKDTFSFRVYGIDDKQISKLKLEKSFSENYVALDRNNKVKVFENIHQILDYYKEVRLEFLEKQRQFDLEKWGKELLICASKYKFVCDVMDEKLIINKRAKNDIVEDMKKLSYYDDNGFDYLLNMSIHSFTKETLEKLVKAIKDLKIRIESKKNEDLNKTFLDNIKQFEELK